MLAVAVLISGRGSNLGALLDAQAADPDFGAEIVSVISDRPEAPGLELARRAGVPTEIVNWSDHPDRAAFSKAVVDTAAARGARLLVLAGFMRVLSREAVERFPNQIINIHPALLPSFPGTHAVSQALQAGVKVTGVTVHFVDELVDHGPIIAQRAVPVLDDDDEETLHARIQIEEHRLYPEVVKAYAHGRIAVDGRHVRWAAE